MRELPENIINIGINGENLTIDQVIAVARFRAKVKIAKQAKNKIERSRVIVEKLVENNVAVYGLTTGFGSKKNVFILPKETDKLQKNLIESHSCGVGIPLSEDIVRAIMLLRANTLVKGYSGIRYSTIEKIIEMLNKGIYPKIPDKGSVGASGDLAPLSHLVLVMMGKGEVIDKKSNNTAPERKGDYIDKPGKYNLINLTKIHDEFYEKYKDSWIIKNNKKRSSDGGGRIKWKKHVKKLIGIEPIDLVSKEGLALNNGAQVMSSIGVITLYDTINLAKNAQIACALSLEAIQGVPNAFFSRLHEVRPHKGQMLVAKNIQQLIEGSNIVGQPINTAKLNRSIKKLEEISNSLRKFKYSREEKVLEIVLEVKEEIKLFVDNIEKKVNEEIKKLPEKEKKNKTDVEIRITATNKIMSKTLERLLIAYKLLLSSSVPSEISEIKDFISEVIMDIQKSVPRMPTVQDAYSFRCAPQVLGASLNAIEYVKGILHTEMNSATDNPLIFPPNKSENDLNEYRQSLTVADCKNAVNSGGNFHGEPIAQAMDYLCIALSEIGNISERRIAHLTDENVSNGLPSFLIKKSGLNSGFMIPQYTAAALVSENKVLSHPASVDSIPTCENSEDHVSMGTIAARKAREILKNIEYIISIELLTAAQGLEFRKPLQPGKGTKIAYDVIRDEKTKGGIKELDEDRIMYIDIEKLTVQLRNELLLRNVEEVIGELI